MNREVLKIATYTGRGRELTDEELVVVRLRLGGTRSAKLYGECMADAKIEAIAARPAVAKAIRRGLRHQIATRAAPSALAALESILATSNHEATVVAAARAVADLWHKAEGPAVAEPEDVAVLDMSEAQLAECVAAMQRELANRRAVEVDSVPVLNDTDSQGTDIFS